MKKATAIILILMIFLQLAACGKPHRDVLSESTEPTIPETTTLTEPTQPAHSDWYISDLSAEDIICYFNEVALHSEYATGTGDATLIQKWELPIYYILEGDYTETDIATIREFADFFNGMTGSPGMYETNDPLQRNLRICFTDSKGIVEILGNNFEYADGGVTYWYDDDRIYDSTICIATYLEGTQRRSVILEELYNGSGLSQDTILRTDSLIYSYSDDAQWMTPVDQLLLMLLYHPQIQPGMDATQCEQVIRTLYY